MINLVFKKGNRNSTVALILAIIIFFSFLLALNFSNTAEQHFSYLSYSFLEGKLFFLEQSDILPPPESLNDVIPWDNHFYWHQGPLPAIILLPFSLIFKFFNSIFYQGFLQFFLVILVFLVCQKIAIKLKYSKTDALYLAYAFCFASMFLGVAMVSWSWYYAQVVAVLLLLLAILEYFNKKRYFLIGVLFGLLALTRVTAGIGIIFFILEIIFIDKRGEKYKKICQLIIPFLLIASFLLIYNYARFDDCFEQGYSLCLLGNLENQDNALLEARSYGIFNLKHLPGNIYYSLLATPLPVFKDSLSHVLKFPFIKVNPWGMSIFLTSPYLIYLFFLKYRDKMSYILLATIFFIAIPIYLYYGIGYVQLGFRYALDFMPFLFLLFMRNYWLKHKGLGIKLKIIIIISSFINLYLLLGLPNIQLGASIF